MAIFPQYHKGTENVVISGKMSGIVGARPLEEERNALLFPEEPMYIIVNLNQFFLKSLFGNSTNKTWLKIWNE